MGVDGCVMAAISMFGDPPPAVAGAGEAWLDVATDDAWLELRRRERRPLAEPLADRISCLPGQPHRSSVETRSAHCLSRCRLNKSLRWNGF